jgi:hypothetical protein
MYSAAARRATDCAVENVAAACTAAAHEEAAAGRRELAAKSVELTHKPSCKPLRSIGLVRRLPQ